MRELPTGTVTFLLTDIVGSTRMWADAPPAMREASAVHDAIVEAAVAAHEGVVVRPRGEGDSRFAVFTRATDGVLAAVEIQRRLHEQVWPEGAQIRVRAALNTGEAGLREGDYYGTAVNRSARLREIAHGGQTLISQVVADLVKGSLPPEIALRDLGRHALRDLEVPERIFQLTHPATPDVFPALRSLEVLPTNLPVQLTSFIGREREMAEVSSLLVPSRLLTLTGSGGCGKTRLALQVAAGLLDRYPDGIWVVELAGVSDPALVPQAVASATGVREESGRDLTDALVAHLRGRETLLILDNCEHVLSACADLTGTLLRACADLQILTTSREPLDVPGESTWVVPSMSLPDAHEPLASLERFEAIKLFVERARKADPQIRLTERTAPAIVQICRRLDGIPLAIELAAARVRALSPDQIAARLDDRFRLLGEARGDLPRHETLAAAVAWSYELLSEEERAMFARVGVFMSGFTVDAVEEICADGVIARERVVPLLTGLVEKSLLQRDARGEYDRYAMLETVRQFAEERLADGGHRAELQRRHLTYFSELAELAEPELRGPKQAHWLDELEGEHDNLRAALDHTEALGSVTQGLRMATAMTPFWEVRGYLSEGRRRLESLLASGEGDREVRAAASGAAGTLALALGDYDAARRHQEESLRQQRSAVGGWPARAGRLISNAARRSLVATIMIAVLLSGAAGLVAGRNTRGVFTGIGDPALEEMARLRTRTALIRWIYASRGVSGRRSSSDQPGIDRSRFPGFRLSAGQGWMSGQVRTCLRLTGSGRQVDGDATDPLRLCEPSVPADAALNYCVCPVPWGAPSVKAVWGAVTPEASRVLIRLEDGTVIRSSALAADRLHLMDIWEGAGISFRVHWVDPAAPRAKAFLSFVDASAKIRSMTVVGLGGQTIEALDLAPGCSERGATCTRDTGDGAKE